MPYSTLQFDSCLSILPLVINANDNEEVRSLLDNSENRIRHCRGGEPNNSCCKGISYVLQREKCQGTCRRLNDISHPQLTQKCYSSGLCLRCAGCSCASP
ncbi:unnamed protein product [Spirodela intermedia]|uniref:Uncharacterized protein n=1 Tax=Spirodela intermedia TaxID=51605 RepID=A0A7I8KYH7_SPIIN|nr:unnamed protein product [Spirodela intermedia]